jgi:chemotaxis methyl-accepting protein methylase
METPATMLELRPQKPPKSAARRLLGPGYRFLRNCLFYDLLLYPYAQAQYRKNLTEKKRSNSHTYTSFYRVPLQLEALTARVIPWLTEGKDRATKLTINVFACSTGAEVYTIASEIMKAHPHLPFTVYASDLHDETVAQGMAATYSPAEVFHNPDIPDAFVTRTFDLVDGRFVVKPEIRARIEFSCADLLEQALSERFAPADIVLAQNVFCHLYPQDVIRAFTNVLKTAKPRSALLIDGMHLDLKEQLTIEAQLAPLDFKCREIYSYARKTHGAKKWWTKYHGTEPYLPWRPNHPRRYGTVFLRGASQSGKA